MITTGYPPGQEEHGYTSISVLLCGEQQESFSFSSLFFRNTEALPREHQVICRVRVAFVCLTPSNWVLKCFCFHFFPLSFSYLLKLTPCNTPQQISVKFPLWSTWLCFRLLGCFCAVWPPDTDVHMELSVLHISRRTSAAAETSAVLWSHKDKSLWTQNLLLVGLEYSSSRAR